VLNAEPNGEGVFGIQASRNVTRVDSFTATSINTVPPQHDQSYLVNGRRYSHDNGCRTVARLVVDSAHVSDKLSSPPIATIDEEDLLSRLDQFPATQSQTSVLRRLSQEYFGASRSRYGINPAGRMSLGSISSSLSTSGNDLSQLLVVKNVDPGHQHTEFVIPSRPSGVDRALEVSDDSDANFVRTRKAQMSLRKAFGIFDDFDVAEAEVVKQLPVLTEDEVPGTRVPSNSAGLASSDEWTTKAGKGRRYSETEFHRQAGDSRNVDRLSDQPTVDWLSDQPTVDRCSAMQRNVDRLSDQPTVDRCSAMQRSVSLGMTTTMTDITHRLSTASDAQSSNSSSSVSTGGLKSSLDLSTGSSSHSTDLLSDVVMTKRTNSKSLSRDVALPSDPVALTHCFGHSDDTQRLEVK